MGLLGNLLNLGGGAKSGKDQNALGSVIDLINNQGGPENLVDKLKQGGLENIVDSWIGTGKNKPVKPDQLSNILGGDAVGQLASKLGISQSAAAANLAQYLPMIIDKLTPNGNASSLSKGINIQDILGSLLKK